MNYIELLNNYWSLREQGILDRNAGDLYLYLIHKSNSLGWKNPFNQSNALICGFLSINEKTLIANRNKIKQEGLVAFVSGKKGTNTEYRLLPVVKGGQNYRESYRENDRDTANTGQNYRENGRENDSQSSSENNSLEGEKSADYIKHKQNETKQDVDVDPATVPPVPDPVTGQQANPPPPVPPPPTSHLFKDVGMLMQECMQDAMFCDPLCMSLHLKPPQLSEWMIAFNKELHFRGEPKKLPNDYRKFFRNWIKLQDLSNDPADYSPVPAQKNDGKRNSETGKESVAGKQSITRAGLAARLRKKVS